MNQSLIQNVIRQSLTNTMKFPQVVGTLLDAGVESYHVDLVRGENRYYAANGETLVEAVPFSHAKPQSAFSAPRVISAIRSVQAGAVDYQGFLNQILDAGCVYYIAYLTGKKVIYFGREGDLHVEHFPKAP